MRIANNVSQTELAKRLEVDNTQICKWEANEYFGVKFETMEKIITALGYKAVTSFKKLA